VEVGFKLHIMVVASRDRDDEMASGEFADVDKSLTWSSQDRNILQRFRTIAGIFVLFLNFFIAQYDKFILSYFQKEITADLGISSTDYGILSGYATSIFFALCAIPVAFLADQSRHRVWILCLATIWWSVMVILQGLSHNFWEIFLARLAMGIGQSASESLSVSLISDMLPVKYVPYGESAFYVGIYIGEAVSANISTAFRATNTSWRFALIAIGVVGVVVAFALFVVVAEPKRGRFFIHGPASDSSITHEKWTTSLYRSSYYVMSLRSFWIITIGSAFRQLGGNVFGFYMPTFLLQTYPNETLLTTKYGIIVAVCGSVAVLLGGLFTSLYFKKRKDVPLVIAAYGGFVSAIFVIFMVVSKSVAHDDTHAGLRILYGTMSAAYLTAEAWLGPLASLLTLLLPADIKTLGLAMYNMVVIFIYSSGPEIVGLGLRGAMPTDPSYARTLEIILAVMIPLSYVIGGVLFLVASPRIKEDIVRNEKHFMILSRDGSIAILSIRRKIGYVLGAVFLAIMVIVLFVTSLVFKT